MRLYDTIQRRPPGTFGAAVSLLVCLRSGRTLGHGKSEKGRAGVEGLGRLAAYGATVLTPAGRRAYLPTEELEPGMAILLRAGDRIPVDAIVLEGRSDIDASLATGESVPESVTPGAGLRAGPQIGRAHV